LPGGYRKITEHMNSASLSLDRRGGVLGKKETDMFWGKKGISLKLGERFDLWKERKGKGASRKKP